MSSIQKGVLSTICVYGKKICMQSVKQVSLLCSKRNSDVQKRTDELQEAIVSCSSADPTSDVDIRAQPKNIKRTKRVRQKKGKSATEEQSKNTTDVLDGDKNNRDAEKRTKTAMLSTISPKSLMPCSTSNNNEETSKNENGKNSNKRRRTKGKFALLQLKSSIADPQEQNKDLDEKLRSSPTETQAVNSKSQKPISISNSVEKESCKSRSIVPGEESKNDDDVSEWQVVKKVRKPRASRPDDVLRAKEQQNRQQINKTGKSVPFQFEAKNNNGNCKNKPVDALKKSCGDTANMKVSEPVQCNTMMGLQSNNGERFTAGNRQTFIRTKVSSNNEIKVNKSKNAKIPTVAPRKVAANKTGIKSDTKRQYDKNEELKRSVKWILNKLTEENVVELTKNLAALPMDTVERLQITADVIFEKALYERNFVHLYASICSDIKSLRVTCDGGKRTIFLLSLILKNCQKQFKVDRAHRADGVKKLDEINLCEDQENKKKLQLDYEINERRSRKRSIGNCRFIGELFKKNLIKTSIMTYCIADLLEQSTESSLECLCILLKTAGTDLEKTCQLNETIDKLKSLTLKKTISLRLRYMIKDTIDLWKKL